LLDEEAGSSNPKSNKLVSLTWAVDEEDSFELLDEDEACCLAL